MNFEHMNAIQRRLHNAACVLGADGDEHGFEQLQRDAIDEIERLRNLVRRALPMADALDATKTAVVWTVDLQVGATALARDIRAALRA